MNLWTMLPMYIRWDRCSDRAIALTITPSGVDTYHGIAIEGRVDAVGLHGIVDHHSHFIFVENASLDEARRAGDQFLERWRSQTAASAVCECSQIEHPFCEYCADRCRRDH